MPDLEYVIAPPKKIISIDWGELWRYRDLFVVLAWRDIAVRYKQTALGALWAILQPFVTMVVFTFIFHNLGKVPSDFNAPYPIFLYVGLLFWEYYANTVTNAANSMVANAPLIQKIYFPRLIIPATAATTGLVDFSLAAGVLAGMMVYYGYCPSLAGILLIPMLLICAVLSALGVGLFLASMNVRYRDIRHVLPFFLRIMMFVTPVIYSAGLLDSRPMLKTLMLWLNPISGVIAGARAAILGRGPVDWSVIAITFFMSVVFFMLGLYYFRNTERGFADIV